MRHLAPLAGTAALLVLAAAHAAAVTVTTADNDSPPGDGLTSLVEAIEAVQPGETISFAIPGAGPHYLATPANGYPLIDKAGVTIDGYTQPGASANTAPSAEPNNAVLRIVLDSRDGGRTVIDYPGFGDSESAVLPVFDAANVKIRGLAFVGIAGAGQTGDASVYNIAFIKGSTGGKVQGCWFGLDPAAAPFAPDENGQRPGIAGARAAVASFKWDDATTSAGLLIGTDSDGTGDNGEFNIFVEQRLAVHLETPDVVVAGNRFNVLPDGSIFDSVAQQTLLEDGTLEAIENGRGAAMRIGTDGDGVNDSNEGNIFGPVRYDVFVEFWRAAAGVVIAGNKFGVDLAGRPAYTLPETTSLLVVRAGSSVRIGSDCDGHADAAEGNRIHGLTGPLVTWHGSNNNPATVARVSLRGNDMTGNWGTFPLDAFVNVAPDTLYGGFLSMVDGVSAPTLSLDTPFTVLAGEVPPALPGTTTGHPVLDLYLADGSTLFAGDPFTYSRGFPQGRCLLQCFEVDGPLDTNPLPNLFSFDVSALGLTEAQWIERVCATANWRLTTGEVVTGNFSAPLDPTLPASPLRAGAATLVGGDFTMAWSGGWWPYEVESSATPGGPWTTVETTDATTFTTPKSGAARYWRVRENAKPVFLQIAR